MNLVSFITLILILAFFAYVIKQWFAYRKVAVNAKGYAKTTGISYLLLAFMALTGILSLSDKFFNTLLNAVLTKIGLPVLDLSQSSEYKWMLFTAFLGLVIAVVLLLKEEKNKAVVYKNNISNIKGDVHVTNITRYGNNESFGTLSKPRIEQLTKEKLKIKWFYIYIIFFIIMVVLGIAYLKLKKEGPFLVDSNGSKSQCAEIVPLHAISLDLSLDHKKFCSSYAVNELNHYHEAKKNKCYISSPDWHPNFMRHYEWCMRVNKKDAHKNIVSHKRILNNCFSINYLKIIH